MVCQQLDQLEWDFIQAREESPDLDSLGWTDRVSFHALTQYWNTSVKGIKANAAFGTKYHSDSAENQKTQYATAMPSEHLWKPSFEKSQTTRKTNRMKGTTTTRKTKTMTRATRNDHRPPLHVQDLQG